LPTAVTRRVDRNQQPTPFDAILCPGFFNNARAPGWNLKRIARRATTSRLQGKHTELKAISQICTPPTPIETFVSIREIFVQRSSRLTLTCLLSKWEISQ